MGEVKVLVSEEGRNAPLLLLLLLPLGPERGVDDGELEVVASE